MAIADPGEAGRGGGLGPIETLHRPAVAPTVCNHYWIVSDQGEVEG